MGARRWSFPSVVVVPFLPVLAALLAKVELVRHYLQIQITKFSTGWAVNTVEAELTGGNILVK